MEYSNFYSQVYYRSGSVRQNPRLERTEEIKCDLSTQLRNRGVKFSSERITNDDGFKHRVLYTE